MSTRVSGRRGWKGALTALLAAALMFTGVGAASAAPTPGTGSVSGTVTRAADGQPAAGVLVQVSLQDFSAGESTTTAPDGTFTVEGLQPGTYQVSFALGSESYVTQWWQGVKDYWQAARIDVAADQAITGIDASLASAGSLSGTATRSADGSPAAGIQVNAYSPEGGQHFAITDDAGGFRMFGMAPGNYQLGFSDPSGQLLPKSTQAVVQADEETPNVDVAMATSATISGHVLAASDGSPVVGAVWATGSSGSFSAAIESDGSYVLHVAPGTYVVHFQPYSGPLLDEYWQHASTAADATPVTVAAGDIASGIDGDLDPARFIRGAVTVDGASDPHHYQDIVVIAETDGGSGVMANVQSDGTFSIQVRPGTYTVRAEGMDGRHWALGTQFYSGANSAAEATPVIVPGTGDATGVDFDLAALTADVSLSVATVPPGAAVHVTGSGFAPGEPVQVELHSTPISLGTVTAGADGVVDTTVTIPADAPAGAHRIVLTGQMSTLTGGSALTVAGATTPGGSDGSGTGGAVTPTPPASASGSGAAQLAATGAEIPTAALLGGALMLLLGLAVIRARRRA
ncbi:collagen binding domain-containing protein [Microbacterium sp. NPDC089698]|uniref:MSCRAMM family protein n=1 Tax=Microbacterium sp. NPDC089698 TaxID=3364200 RepID=UPI003822BA84